MNPRIYLSSPHMSGREIKYVQEAFETNWIAPLGPNVDGFERELEAATGAKHVAALSSGTSAIHLALILSGVKAGDLVIGSSFTFSATINPIAYLGATPVLVDSEKETWNMDPTLLEQAIESSMNNAPGAGHRTQDKGQSSVSGVHSVSGAKPKAVIVAHLYGMPAKMEEIMAVTEKYDIPVIEDAAEALGAEYKGKRVGCAGKFGILSFNGNKIITTSGGGALLSDDEELIRKARFLSTQARDKAPHYQHSEIGYNYRMSNVVAGIGRGQLEVLDERVRQRRQINRRYRELLKNAPGVTFQTEPSKDYVSNYWLTCVVIDPDRSGTDRETLRKAFEAENIEARPLWKPMHLQPVFAGSPAYVNGTSEKLFDQGLCLPSGSNMTDEEFDRISEVLKKAFRMR